MLILSRRLGETIIINNQEINIRVLEIRGNQVKLGIQASRDIPVHRSEIYEKIQAEKELSKMSH